MLIGSWSDDNLMIPHRVNEVLPIPSQASSYSIGTGGDFNTARPLTIESAYIRQDGIDYPLDIVPLEQYNRIANKSIQTRPDWLFYENSYPLGKIYFDFQPDTTMSLGLSSLKELTQLTNLSTSISLPKSYERALKFNLAIELCGEYGKEPRMSVVNGATESKAAIERRNNAHRVPQLTVERALVRTRYYNIYSD
jgi:hypothetical protein